ncbi:hypothetical protein E8E15_005512 [Penicillium rubens]|nr:hypothetical protein E8E15_005512 [Penicillium rubens]
MPLMISSAFTLFVALATHRPPDSDGSAIELNNLPPLPAPGSTPDLLDSPVPDSGSPTLLSHRCQVISAASKPSSFNRHAC